MATLAAILLIAIGVSIELALIGNTIVNHGFWDETLPPMLIACIPIGIGAFILAHP